MAAKLNHHLDDGLVDLSGTMKDLVEKAQILAEKKGKFKGE